MRRIQGETANITGRWRVEGRAMVSAIRSGNCDFLGLRGGSEMVTQKQTAWFEE